MVRQALEGIRVADFSWVGVGPWTIRHLADHGADVIHVETPRIPDMLRLTPPYKNGIIGVNRAGYQAKFNVNKYGISLNLGHPKGLEIAKKLVAWADIVGESFSPGTMERLGLGYDELKKIKPDIIMIRLSSLGQTGPHAQQRGVGANLVSLAGFTHITGWPDKAPSGPYGAYTDTLAPRVGAAALIAALDYRRRTGKGQCIDVSQFEAGIYFQAPLVLDYAVNKRIANRVGNRHSYAAPHGAYPCLGNDRWCVIAVFTDAEWDAFCQVIGNPQWTKDPRFATILGRKRNEDELNELVATWTVDFTPEEVMTRMQQAGVAAAVVAMAEDLYHDPQLEHRHHFWTMEHPEMGTYHPDSPAFKLSRTPSQPTRCSPIIGRDNEYVYTKILGISDKEFVELLADGVFE